MGVAELVGLAALAALAATVMVLGLGWIACDHARARGAAERDQAWLRLVAHKAQEARDVSVRLPSDRELADRLGLGADVVPAHHPVRRPGSLSGDDTVGTG